MQIIHGMKGLGAAIKRLRARGRIAMVPTMGALHPGHMALITDARARADAVVASIFVNPLQFNDAGDLARYPRQKARDAQLLEDHGCDLLWMPSADDFYPEGFVTTISVGGITDRWEGEHRPGHFDGVATVVTKLFTCIRPDVAIFGEKDFQQLALIRRFTRDLNLGVEIVGHPTVREEDGLAMSSRNALLSADERVAAIALPHALREAASSIRGGAKVETALAGARAALTKRGFGPIDYIAYVDPDSLEPLDKRAEKGRLLAAAFLGKVRLIDNLAVDPDPGATHG